REQESIRNKAKEMLATFMIRRDQHSKIRGDAVLRDYFKECTVLEEPLVPTDGGREVAYRERLYRQSFGIRSDVLTKSRNDNMRCLSWSYRFIPWQTADASKRAAIWSDYTLEEASDHIRTRALIRILTRAKRSGNGCIIFVQRVFLAELSLKE